MNKINAIEKEIKNNEFKYQAGDYIVFHNYTNTYTEDLTGKIIKTLKRKSDDKIFYRILPLDFKKQDKYIDIPQNAVMYKLWKNNLKF